MFGGKLAPRVFALIAASWQLAAWAQQGSLLDETHTVGDDQTVAIVEEPLDIHESGSYRLTVTDAVSSQLPLDSFTAAIIQGGTVLGVLTGSGSKDFELQQGSYVIHIVGKPAAAAGIGYVKVSVIHLADNAQILLVNRALALAAPSTLSNDVAVIDTSFTISAAGNYSATVGDLQLPQSLAVLRVGILSPDAASVAVNFSAPGTQTFSAVPGEYHIFVIAQAQTTSHAGLMSVGVTAVSNGANVFSRVMPVGQLRRIGTATLASGTQVLSLTDLAFPAPLAQSAAAVVLNGVAVANIPTGPGTASFTATADDYEIFVLATPQAATNGSYSLDIRPQGSTAATFSAVDMATRTAGAASAFQFSVDVANPGAYNLRLADFQFPDQSFAELHLAAVQGGAILGNLGAAGSLALNLSAGRLFVLVTATPGSGSKGLLGLDLTPNTGGAALFEATQAVGSLFDAFKISVAAAGSYRVTLSDLGFPAGFTTLAAVVTRGAERAGYRVGQGVFDFDAVPGNYFINFIATPDTTQKAGTYRLAVGPKPPTPTVNLEASKVVVESGQTVRLIWSSTDAQTCTASGGWSGSRSTSDSNGVESAPITASTTFTLQCTGEGGSATDSVTVDIKQDKGGGGGLDRGLLLVCLAAWIAAVSRRYLRTAAL